jgi:hypothetical protein
VNNTDSSHDSLECTTVHLMNVTMLVIDLHDNAETAQRTVNTVQRRV